MNSTFDEWAKKKRLNLLGWLSILCFIVGGFTALGLLYILWDMNKVEMIIMLALLVAGWVLMKIVNGREKTYREQERGIWNDYYKRWESCKPEGRDELEWRMLKCEEFIRQGIDPAAAYWKANKLEYDESHQKEKR